MLERLRADKEYQQHHPVFQVSGVRAPSPELAGPDELPRVNAGVAFQQTVQALAGILDELLQEGALQFAVVMTGAKSEPGVQWQRVTPAGFQSMLEWADQLPNAWILITLPLVPFSLTPPFWRDSMMPLPADQLNWHDALLDHSTFDPVAGVMTWTAQVFRWDLWVFNGENFDGLGDAQGGRLVFRGVLHVEGRHDTVVDFTGDVDFTALNVQILRDDLERQVDQWLCEFKLHVSEVTNALGGPGCGEIQVVCQDAYFEPREPWVPY